MLSNLNVDLRVKISITYYLLKAYKGPLFYGDPVYSYRGISPDGLP